MENYFETKHKPLGSRIFAVLTAFIAGLSIIGNNSFIAKAESISSDKSVVQSEQSDDIPEIDLDEPGYIIDDNPEATAKFTPLSEEELADIEALRFESLKTATLKAGEENNEDGFIYSIDHVYELANSSLKNFFYQYAFTSTEVLEGDTSNYIVRSDNFVPKGIVTINVEHLIEPGHIEFRVPMYLFQYRNGEYCKINSIGAPAFKTGFIPVKDSNGVYDLDNIDAYKNESRQTSFNYYIDNETKEYVFINYGALASGSSDIQISYDKVDIFNVKDDTEWEITPKANIVFFEQKNGNLRYNGDIVQKSDGTRNYFTECDLTENGNTSKIYMLGAETDSSSGFECILYCDVTGTPVFLHTKDNATSENKWYDLRGKGKTIEMSYAEIRGGLSPMADEDIPSIEMSYEQVTVTKETADAVRGRVDTNVTLDSVTKSPEPNNSSGYGSQVYSMGQMKKYISVDNLPYQVKNGTGLSDNYIYTCWRVYTKGKCTQPWSMLLKDIPKVARFISGTNELETDSNGDVIYYDVPGALVLGVSTMMPNNYSKRSDHKVSESNTDDIRRLKTYVDSSDLSGKNDCWYVADTNTEMRGSFALQNVTKEHKYDKGYYVVVAYPKDQLTHYQNDDIDQYPPLKNEVTVYLYSRDKTSNDEKSAESDGSIVYKKFEWTGGEEYWHTYKRVDGECKDGLLSVYDKLAGDHDDYIGDIWFHESYRGGAYSCCHNTKTYNHIDGLYYKVINTDDVLTAQPYGEIKVDGALKRVYGKPQLLDGKDYFYSKAVLTLSEFEVDPFEDYVYSLDAAAASEEILAGHSDKINRDWVVYGWYEGGTDWVEIDLTKFGYAHAHFTMQDYLNMKKGNDKICLTLNFMDKGYECPFRLKVEHNCIGYNTQLNWDLETQLKLDSQKFNSSGSLRGANTFCYLDDNNEVVEKSAGELDFETFRISLRNYSATKATKYEATYDSENNKVIETPKGELITNFNDSADKYYNIEGWADRTLVNANRYLFIDGDLFFDDGTFIHCNKDNMDKSDLGTALLKADRLESPYGTAEYLPLKYINGDQTFSDLDEFLAANTHVYRDHAAIDVSLLETDAHAEKFATWENDTKNGQVIMTYTLSGYEGYKLSKELRQLVENLNVLSGDALPTRNKVVLCDLLPLGVNYYGYEEPVLGKLTTTKIADSEEDITADMVDNYVSTWDKSGAHLAGVYVEENWEDTNRTMVKFVVEFDNTDAILTDSNWFIGCGIKFKAYVAWDNYSTAREKDNIFAYAVHSDDTHNGGNIYGRYSGTSDSQVYDGAGIHIPATSDAKVDYSSFKNKTLPYTKTGETDHNRMYGHANDMESITMARTLGITKQVKADDNIYAEYDEMTSVVKNHDYTYRIHIDKTAQGSVNNVVVFDQIEKIGWEHNGNFGIFQGLDLSELLQNYPELEDDITIYYSKDRLAPTTLYKLNNNDFIFRPDTSNYMSLAENVYEAQGIKRAPWNFDTVNSLITEQCLAGTWDHEVGHEGVDDANNYKWFTKQQYDAAGYELNEVKSIAISFGDHVFDNAFTFNIYVKMKAPDGQDDKFALNEASYFFNDEIDTSNYEYSKSEIIVVSFGDEKILDVIKKVVGEMPDEIDDSYIFKIVSYMVYQENDQGKEFDFSNIGYTLYREGENDHMIHATNTEGEFRLKDKEMAEFSSISVVENQTGGYDFANFRIIEKSTPFLLSVESVNTVQGTVGNNREQVTFTNYYRPVVYLTKKTKGVPDGVTLDSIPFSYKIKIYEGDSTTPLSFTNGSGYKLLSKETAETGDSGILRRKDARENNKLYWYKVMESAGWFDTPQGWNVNDSYRGLYNTDGSAFDNDNKCFTVTIKSGETVAVPIYIQHIVGGNDVGMLDENGKPRYRIEIEEVEENDWYCTSANRSGELGAGENSYIWVNNYMYKELLVKKTVTHAPSESELRSTPFKFKLTDKNGAPYYEYKAGQTVHWQLCTMDKQGNITELSGAGTSGTVANDGTFTVTGCGNASDSTGDVYVIKLNYVKLETGGKTAEYTVTEVELDSDYSASKVSDTVEVKANAVYTTANIENDYLKRDITINKIVAAKIMPGADKKFTIVLCPDGVETLPAAPSYSAVDKNGDPITVTLTQTNTPAKGWSFGLSAGDSITFSDVGKVGEKYDVYELVDETYQPLTFIGDNTVGSYANITHITLDSMNDTNVDVINGGEGYIVLRKQFKGDISELSDELNASNISIKLELRKTDGTYIVPSASSASANITVSGASVSDAGAITFTHNDNVIINMGGLISENSTASLDGAFRVTETYAHKIFHGLSCYVVEPEKADGIWEFNADTKQGILVNNVSEFKSSNVIYKRIGLKEDSITAPTGAISFSIRDHNGDPVQGVRCFVSKFNPSGEVETSTDAKYISDENGIITIDFDDEVRNNGWRNTNKNMQYMLKMYFDRAVKINPSDPNVLSITENTYATDKSWGTPVGYEKYADPDTYISGEMLETSGLSQWIIADADTFVNTQDTEQISFTKKVNATGDIDPETSERIYTDEDNDTLFKFVVSELIGKDYQPAPHISYKVYNEDDELVRKGVTDYDENDKNSGWGVFTLHRGEKVVLDIPKNTYWYVGEDNTGKYKLVTDDSGEITTGEDEKALHIKPVTDISYDADYLMQGFSFHTTLDMIQGYPMSYDVVLINGRASQNSPMFAKYDESHDSWDMADDGVTEVSRTARLKSGQSAAENFYYVGSYNYTASKYNGEGILGSTISKIYSGNDESEMWSYNSGTSSAYKANSLTLPDTVIIEDNEGKRTEHKIVGIGKEAYSTSSKLQSDSIISINIPKYVKKIGDNAFNHNFYLANVDMSRCTDLKVIGVAAFADGSMSIYMPDTVETVEDTAFAQYHTTSGTRNNSNNSFTIPSALCHLTNKANVPDQRFGSLGHYTSNITLRIGGGDSISDMMTSFRTITEGKYHEIYTLGLGDIPFVPYNVIIGQNPDGLRIKEAARFHWDRNGGTNNTNMIYGRIIVFPKGDLTLEAQALRQNGQISSLNFLRVFLTEDPTDLKIEGDMDTYGDHIQYIVFPNLTRDEALADSNWTTKENYLKSASSSGNVHIYYRDDLTSTAIQNIISAVGTGIVDDDVKQLLYTSAGLPIPEPLPAPRHLTAPDKVISNNDIYLEKKRELLD